MILRVRFHGRGGQGGKTASRILGDAAFKEGFQVQDFPLYGAERRGAPVAAFTRISDEPILERGYISDPDLVVVMDETLLTDAKAQPLQGVRKGGVVFVNAQVNYTSSQDSAHRYVTLDLTKLALETVGKPILSAASAAVAARLLGVISENSLLAAVRAELTDIGVSGETQEKNVALASSIYRMLEPTALNTLPNDTKVRLTPLVVLAGEQGNEDVIAVGNSYLNRTGDWRIYKPVINYEKCTNCMVCYDYCPESAMTVRSDGAPQIDYDNCKGCLICYRECPLKAVTIEMEVRAA